MCYVLPITHAGNSTALRGGGVNEIGERLQLIVILTPDGSVPCDGSTTSSGALETRKHPKRCGAGILVAIIIHIDVKLLDVAILLHLCE